ncbi:MAG: ATP-binding protein [Lachnospiraceae bacterium]|nr:ATP-binding protein [Lachnospiraceae bacterium]
MEWKKEYTFDTFRINDGNRFAKAAAYTVAQSSERSYIPLYIFGGSGTGKTHLTYAIGNYIKDQAPGCSVLYLGAEDYCKEIRKRMGESVHKINEYRANFRYVDVLLIEDVNLIKEDMGNEVLYHIINDFLNWNKRIVITSDCPPDRLDVDARLLTKMESGIIAEIN